MDLFTPLLNAIPAVMTFPNLLAMVGGVLAGIIVGSLPGLTATMSIAVLLPLTFAMDPLVALGMMAGIYNGAMYGGAIPAILLRIPGTPAAIVTTFDGYPLAQQGKAGYALQIALLSSAFGGMMSAVAMMILAPPLSLVTLAFGPPEVFWVGIFGMAAVSVFLGDDLPKGLLAALLGLFVGMIGLDPVMSTDRFTFGALELESGIDIVVLMVGLYAIPPCIDMAEETFRKAKTGQKLEFAPFMQTVREIPRFFKVWSWAYIYGIFVGLLPGASGSFVSFLAYERAKKMSKDPQSFGKGNPEGVAASEFGNNADNAAALIPTVTLGIPGSSVAAVIMGGLLVHGLQPGPDLFRNSADIIYGFMIQMFLTSLILIPLGGSFATNLFAQVLRIPRPLLIGLILCLSIVGAYCVQNSIFDVWLMFGFGLLGYVMSKTGLPLAPVALGVILGPLIESNLRLSLLLDVRNEHILFTRPICMVLIALLVLTTVFPPLWKRFSARRKKAQDAA
ncbi:MULTISPECIES: tripartite tricarboxylate transporter permease [Thalassospira]|uniref:C4-dicarboxylate ABC transporter permease n=2 Tax=Thalassospira TaxID=168934 RepID=A0A367VZU8_9PROT|nr:MULTISPECIES: tripartite tricarboxylate transporter permease [Thalassospira]MDG4720300.1 tripartite tricarboxylate transporter permease [Thalassospira sp. FZY0004]RCK32203.1 C4-dicarboxylate ABC transporter permease [Thalassospira profundimaris]